MDEATDPLDPSTAARLERLRALARLMDTRLRLPLVPLRFGLDSVVGLVPVVGDTVSWAVAGWIVAEARKLGAPPELVGRMLANNAFDWAIGLVPVAGDLLDVGMRANTRNVRLLENALRAEAGGVSRGSDRATAPKRRSSPRT
jgi:hypothetical protein